ncbi:MAG: DHH family phosphoesterase [Caldisphaera sp.]
MIKTNSQNFLSEFIEEINNGKIGISFHSNADLDALASSLIIYQICKKYNDNCCIDTKPGLSKESKIALKELNININECNSDYDKLIILDAGGIEQVSEIISKPRRGVLILIDHHSEGELHKNSKLYYIDSEASSTTEIAVTFSNKLNLSFNESISNLAILGIIFDSNKLERARKNTFESLVFLTEHGDYKKSISIYYNIIRSFEEDFSVRIAKLKGLSRLLVGKACGNLIVALTEIGSYESLVSSNIIQNGADVVFVIKNKESNNSRISIRISDRALLYGIDASYIAKILGEKFQGEGGGHRGASIVSLPKNVDIEKEKFFSYLINFINGVCNKSEIKNGSKKV